MLRKLFIKKNSFLFKKNLVTNYFLYNSLLFDFLKKKNKYFDNFEVFKNTNYDVYNPVFFYSKKLFYLDKDFLNILKNNNLNYIFINKNYKKLQEISGNKIIIPNNSIILKNIVLKNIKEEEILPISLKYTEIYIRKNSNSINLFFNYNIYMLQQLEIYKILILINIYSNFNKNN